MEAHLSHSLTLSLTLYLTHHSESAESAKHVPHETRSRQDFSFTKASSFATGGLWVREMRLFRSLKSLITVNFELCGASLTHVQSPQRELHIFNHFLPFYFDYSYEWKVFLCSLGSLICYNSRLPRWKSHKRSIINNWRTWSCLDCADPLTSKWLPGSGRRRRRFSSSGFRESNAKM